MTTVELRLTTLILALGIWGSLPCQAAPPRGGAAPLIEISPDHRAFLSRVARRTIRDKVLKRPPYEVTYVPSSLRTIEAEVVVRARTDGFLRATGLGRRGPVAEATRDAALAAASFMAHGAVVDPDVLGNLLIEIEAAGEDEPIEVQGDWTLPGALAGVVEPGIHGVVVQGPNRARRICPSEILGADLRLEEALRGVAQSEVVSAGKLQEAKLERFRTAHWYEARAGAPTVLLRRGMTLVEPGDVRARTLDRSIDRLAAYMAYRQKPSGLFTYQFEPGRDRYSTEDNLVRQVGAVVGLAVHARYRHSAASCGATDLAIRYHLQGLADIPGASNASFIATADRTNKLGVTALLCMAMHQHPEPERFAPVRQRLTEGILWLQQPNGMFVTAFPPAVQVDAQEYFPGEALLALAMEYARQPSSRILDAFDRAIDFYRDYFRHRRSPALVPWQVQAFAAMAEHSDQEDFAAFVFELTDWLAGMQLNGNNCTWPQLIGGIAPLPHQSPSAATAAYLEAFADALILARRQGDQVRADKYARATRLATRFVLQLQVRPEEAYHMRSPQDAVGGIRAERAVHLLRIDHCHHSMVALIKARNALFPDSD